MYVTITISSAVCQRTDQSVEFEMKINNCLMTIIFVKYLFTRSLVDHNVQLRFRNPLTPHPVDENFFAVSNSTLSCRVK